jgi:hypothetical protein
LHYSDLFTYNGKPGIGISSGFTGIWNICKLLVISQLLSIVAATQYSISTIVGTGVAGATGNGGLATSATLSAPQGIWGDSNGNLYISDSTYGLIRKSGVDSILQTVAGQSIDGSTLSGAPATATTLTSPNQVIMIKMDNNVSHFNVLL